MVMYASVPFLTGDCRSTVWMNIGSELAPVIHKQYKQNKHFCFQNQHVLPICDKSVLFLMHTIHDGGGGTNLSKILKRLMANKTQFKKNRIVELHIVLYSVCIQDLLRFLTFKSTCMKANSLQSLQDELVSLEKFTIQVRPLAVSDSTPRTVENAKRTQIASIDFIVVQAVCRFFWMTFTLERMYYVSFWWLPSSYIAWDSAPKKGLLRNACTVRTHVAVSSS